MVLLDLENELIDVLPGLSMPAGAASFVFARIEWIQAFFWRKRKPEEEKEENIWRRSLKDNEKSRFRSRDFCQFLESFSIGFGEFGLEKMSRFRFQRIWSRKKVLVSVLENLVCWLENVLCPLRCSNCSIQQHPTTCNWNSPSMIQKRPHAVFHFRRNSSVSVELDNERETFIL